MAGTVQAGRGGSDIPVPNVPGLHIRRLDAPADHRRMNEIANASRMAQNDGLYTMVRPTLDDLPDADLPAGLEIREVRPEHMEAIFQAQTEALRDHWGFAEPGERERQEFFNDPVRSDTSLWRVAWDGDQVAGM